MLIYITGTLMLSVALSMAFSLPPERSVPAAIAIAAVVVIVTKRVACGGRP